MAEKRLFNIRWFGLVFASLVLGIAFSPNLLVGIIFFVCLIIASILIFGKSTNRVAILVIAITYLVGFIYSSVIIHVENDKISQSAEVLVVGKVISTTSTNHAIDDGAIVIIDNVTYAGQPVDGKVRLFVDSKDTEKPIEIGDQLSYIGGLEAIPLKIDSIGASHYYVDGIKYIGVVDSISEVEFLGRNARESIVYAAKNLLFSRLDPDTAGFLVGMMFGDTSSLGGNIKMASRRLGTAHLFAVSGLHVSMLAGFLIMILKKLKIRNIYLLLVLPFLAFYIYLCNFAVSVMRASIMLTIYIISTIIHKRYDMLSSLSLAGIILLLICPMYLFDVSFILSFLAVLSLILFASRINKFLIRKSTKYAGLKSAFAANIAVNIGLLPMMLHLFGGVSLLTFPANIVIIPLVSIIFPIFFIVFSIVLIFNIGVLVPIICLPFKLIVEASISLAGLNMLSINFDVSAYFVCTYIIVMIVASKFVFISKTRKMVPKILLLLLVVAGIITPPITKAVKGDVFVGSGNYRNYSLIFEDDNGDNVLVLMGNIDEYCMKNAITNMNSMNIGNIDIIVAHNLHDGGMELINYYRDILGTKLIVSDDMAASEASHITSAYPSIQFDEYDNVRIRTKNLDFLLISPANHEFDSKNADVVITANDNLSEGESTPKYYINFAKHSHRGSITDFTFFVKNGIINSESIAYGD